MSWKTRKRYADDYVERARQKDKEELLLLRLENKLLKTQIDEYKILLDLKRIDVNSLEENPYK